jgi:ABC-type Fe3+-siderophore transport system permease subunit
MIMKNTKQQTIAEIKADITNTRKHIRYCELIVAACAGACLALAGVIAHMMITGPAWTW